MWKYFLCCHETLMRSLFLIILLMLPLPAFGDDGKLIQVRTRPGVTVPVYLMENSGAAATLALLPGGNGSITLSDGVPDSRDFLVKNRSQFVRQGFNVAVVGRPRDKRTLDLPTRNGAEHMVDLHRVVQYLKTGSSLPVWLVGMSRGTVSAAGAAIAFGNENLAGIVLASSVTSSTIPYAVPRLRLDKIRIPVLVLHHEKDECRICDPEEVPEIMTGLVNAPIAKAVLVSGGRWARGNPCTSSHWHGYSGMEKEAVNIIARWIKSPTR